MLYPSGERATLARKLFRREPAITEFDELFTPYHRSLESIARLYHSDLPLTFVRVHPVHGKLTRLRVFCIVLVVALLTLGFPMAALIQELSLAQCKNSLAHSSIGTQSRI